MIPRRDGTVPLVIRTLTADEVAWFLARTLAYQGHGDPMGLAMRLKPRLRDARRDAERCQVWQPAVGPPTAGAYLIAPTRDDDDRSLELGPLWHEGDVEDARAFVTTLLARTRHEAAIVHLDPLPRATRAAYRSWLAPLGFEEQERVRLRFPLAEVPPLGTPLSLEAWSEERDALFRDTFVRAEGVAAGEGRWAWLKRRGGRFRPDLWFVVRAAPDQEPVGYAFCHGSDGVDGRYRLEAAGVMQDHRGSTEMLRRLVLTTLHELAARSPFGTVDARPAANDPKLIEILRSLGFESVRTEQRLKRLPA